METKSVILPSVNQMMFIFGEIIEKYRETFIKDQFGRPHHREGNIKGAFKISLKNAYELSEFIEALGSAEGDIIDEHILMHFSNGIMIGLEDFEEEKLCPWDAYPVKIGDKYLVAGNETSHGQGLHFMVDPEQNKKYEFKIEIDFCTFPAKEFLKAIGLKCTGGEND